MVFTRSKANGTFSWIDESNACIKAGMRIDFLGLQAFLSIAERGSFQRAAAHLNLSQTAVSHRMRKLEDELGIKLFARTTREVTLTRAGIDFLPKAQRAIAGLEQSGEVEFGLSVIQTNRWDLDVEAIADVPLVLACPTSHPLARKRAVTWKELRDTPLIRVGTKTAIRSIIDDAMGAAQLAANWQYEVQHVETAVHLVEAGLGLAVVLSVDVAFHRGRRVIAVPLRSPKTVVTYGLVTRRGMPLSPAAAAMRGLLVEELSAAAA